MIGKELSKPLRFKTRSIPPDGRCFWYSWLSCRLPDEWWAIKRNESGYAIAKGRLEIEEKMGEALCNEVLQRLMSSSKSTTATDLFQEIQDMGLREQGRTNIFSLF